MIFDFFCTLFFSLRNFFEWVISSRNVTIYDFGIISRGKIFTWETLLKDQDLCRLGFPSEIPTSCRRRGARIFSDDLDRSLPPERGFLQFESEKVFFVSKCPKISDSTKNISKKNTEFMRKVENLKGDKIDYYAGKSPSFSLTIGIEKINKLLEGCNHCKIENVIFHGIKYGKGYEFGFVFYYDREKLYSPLVAVIPENLKSKFPGKKNSIEEKAKSWLDRNGVFEGGFIFMP